jgi:hypothetical protein
VGIHRTTLARAAEAGILRRVGRGRYVDGEIVVAAIRSATAEVSRHAVVAYDGAAAYYGLDAIPPDAMRWIVPHNGSRPRGTHKGLVRRRRRFEDIEIVERDGLLVTSVRQTLADLAAMYDVDVVERALESALRLDLADELALRDFAYLFVYARHGGPALRAVLDRRPHGAPPTDSDIETRLIQVYRRGGVPTPQRQWPIYGPDGSIIARADCGFPPLAFGTEVDGFESHGTPDGLQYDLNRQNRVLDTGFTLRRFTYDDVDRRHRYVCTETLKGLAMATLLPDRLPPRLRMGRATSS